MPIIVYQDDDANQEATVDVDSQSVLVNPGTDKRNRSLLKFESAGTPWYVNLYTQAETRSTEKNTSFSQESNVVTATVDSTTGLEVGMKVSGSGYSGTIESILDDTRYIISSSTIYAIAAPVIQNPSFEDYSSTKFSRHPRLDICGGPRRATVQWLGLYGE